MTNKTKEKVSISPETRDEAIKIASSTKKPRQSKEQTKLIAQGIQKGIAQYKKQQKVKNRESDKKHKKAIREKADKFADTRTNNPRQTQVKSAKLPWLLLVFSWLFFIGYLVTKL